MVEYGGSLYLEFVPFSGATSEALTVGTAAEMWSRLGTGREGNSASVGVFKSIVDKPETVDGTGVIGELQDTLEGGSEASSVSVGVIRSGRLLRLPGVVGILPASGRRVVNNTWTSLARCSRDMLVDAMYAWSTSSAVSNSTQITLIHRSQTNSQT
jgi:hypothetical protein